MTLNTESLLALGLTDAQAAQVMESLNGAFVPKARFNEINTQLSAAKASLKERDGQLEALRGELEEAKAARMEPVPEDEAVEAAFRFNQTVQAAADQLRTFFRLVPVDVAARELELCAQQLERQRDELYTMAQRAANLALADSDGTLPPIEEDES